MKTYWDTSAAIKAAISPEVFRLLESGEHVARLHLLAEFFATMTGRGVEITDEEGNSDRMVFTQNESAAWLRKFVELTKEEALTAPPRLPRTFLGPVRVGFLKDFPSVTTRGIRRG